MPSRSAAGLESVTLEMIKNDDVGAIARIPNRLARAAKRTLCKFVMDFIKNNAAIYDTKALFHVDHGNLGSAALSAATYAAARLAMVTQRPNMARRTRLVSARRTSGFHRLRKRQLTTCFSVRRTTTRPSCSSSSPPSSLCRLNSKGIELFYCLPQRSAILPNRWYSVGIKVGMA